MFFILSVILYEPGAEMLKISAQAQSLIVQNIFWSICFAVIIMFNNSEYEKIIIVYRIHVYNICSSYAIYHLLFIHIIVRKIQLQCASHKIRINQAFSFLQVKKKIEIKYFSSTFFMQFELTNSFDIHSSTNVW